MAEIFNFYVYDNRTIQFPKNNLLEPIMQEDKDVATWRFRIPKVLNNIDMSGWAWWFVYVNAKGQEYSELLTLTDDIDEPASYSTADYDIDYGISKFPGSFSFALEAISTEQGGEISGEWHTRTYTHTVTPTLQGNQAEYAEAESDVISALMQEVRNKVNQLVGGATPLPVNLKSKMADHDKVYLYTGEETGESTGYWYYWNGTDFVPGGLYAAGIQIDPTLTQSGQAADAKVVGEKVKYNVSDILSIVSHNTADISAGIRYEWNKTNVCTVSGTATGSSINNIINNGLLADYGLEIGKTYPVKYQSTNVVLRIYCRVSGTFTEIVNTKTDATFTVPEGTTDFTVRLTVPNGTTVSETISPKILTAKTNEELQEELATTSASLASLATIKRTEAGILTPYFASWDVQFTDSVFSLLDMPLNTIAYTQFSGIDPTEVADFPITDFGAVYIEKTGRGNFAFYRIYANNRPHIVCGYYSGGSFYWYCNQSIYPLKIGMMGDSVTAGRIGGESGNTNKGIPYWVMCETGMPVTNLGVGSQGWISKQYLDQNAEEYIQTLDLSSYDVLTFMYGANDGDIELGDYEDTTEQTIMGAVYRCVNYAMTQKPTLRIILINPPLGKGSSFPYYNPSAQHSASDHWKFTDYFEQMHLFCTKYAIPVIDGWEALNAWNRATYIGDNIHPTVAGYKVIGQYLAGKIKALI